ncbi:RNA splicing factor [Lithospermum erythrorhizon]|uniref:RNA splicing factor n=1 Tax=Lithospermum erythrorhizon TaxID=34254 RepID=A0AAV3PFD3_LITER
MATEEELSIEAAVAERRERIQALHMAHQLSNTPDDDQLNNNNNNNNMEDGEDDQVQENQNVSVKFRNYLPHDKQLQDGRLPPPVLPKFEDPVAAAAAQEETKEDPFLNIAPKKPNWDLRRDVQKKLDKLERRTQKAIFQLMQEEENRRKLAEETEDQD